MKNRLCITDDDRWQSVVDRDVDADGQFVLPSRPPVFSAVRPVGQNMRCAKCPFYADAQQAQDAGFRPVSAASRIKTARNSIGWTKLPAPVSCWSKSHLLRWTSWHSRWQ